MQTIKLTSNRQITIPDNLCQIYNWHEGQEFIIVYFNGSVILKPTQPFKPTTLDDVAGCLPYHGKPKTLEDMETAIRIGVSEQYNDRSGY
jgi:bifunctional DNA-binding transcriptional regulator/antitoxin component of YhaV-PrlF toxin-antitoxin module